MHRNGHSRRIIITKRKRKSWQEQARRRGAKISLNVPPLAEPLLQLLNYFHGAAELSLSFSHSKT
jgi:hypothetical protein